MNDLRLKISRGLPQCVLTAPSGGHPVRAVGQEVRKDFSTPRTRLSVAPRVSTKLELVLPVTAVAETAAS